MIQKSKIENWCCVLLTAVFLYSVQGCKSTSSTAVTPPGTHPSVSEVSAAGTLLPQGATSYQYGMFILVDENGKTIYALKSDTLQLLNYTGKKVSLNGMLIEGYPLEGGPPYLNVTALNEIDVH